MPAIRRTVGEHKCFNQSNPSCNFSMSMGALAVKAAKRTFGRKSRTSSSTASEWGLIYTEKPSVDRKLLSESASQIPTSVCRLKSQQMSQTCSKRRPMQRRVLVHLLLSQSQLTKDGGMTNACQVCSYQRECEPQAGNVDSRHGQRITNGSPNMLHTNTFAISICFLQIIRLLTHCLESLHCAGHHLQLVCFAQVPSDSEVNLHAVFTEKLQETFAQDVMHCPSMLNVLVWYFSDGLTAVVIVLAILLV